jgi:hypothetical protein
MEDLTIGYLTICMDIRTLDQRMRSHFFNLGGRPDTYPEGVLAAQLKKFDALKQCKLDQLLDQEDWTYNYWRAELLYREFRLWGITFHVDKANTKRSFVISYFNDRWPVFRFEKDPDRPILYRAKYSGITIGVERDYFGRLGITIFSEQC